MKKSYEVLLSHVGKQHQAEFKKFCEFVEQRKTKQLIANLEKVKNHSTAIMQTAGDPRHRVVKKIIPLIVLALRNIDRGYDCGYELVKIEKLCNSANMLIVGPLASKGQKFNDGPKNPRHDALRKLMLSAADDFEKIYGETPSAKQLWAFLPVGDVVQEKAEETGDFRDWVLFWRCPNGTEKETSFKSFQNRYSSYLKKIKKS